MSDLGDLSNFLKEGSLANLDWLEVDEQEYREMDRLPRQNLDIAPDLQAIWSHEDKPSTTYLQPNTGPVHTMGDLSSEHGKLRAKPEEIIKTARLALMANTTLANFKEQLLRRFTKEDLRVNRTLLAKVLEERGLLGSVYIAASDFSGCHNSPKVATTFVRKHASDASFVVAKPECGSCIHANRAGSTTNCAVFHKELVLEVPFTEQLANSVEKREQFRGKSLQASTGKSPKERIRLAVLSDKPLVVNKAYDGVGVNQTPQSVKMTSEKVHEQLISASNLLKKKSRDEKLSLKAKPIVAFLRREMLKSRTAHELISTLKVSFPVQDLSETRKEWEPLFNQVGLFGTVYSSQDSFDDCHEGADFLAKHNPNVRALVAGAKCESCIYNKISRCLMYGKPLVKEAQDVLTWETANAVAQEHKQAGRLQPWEVKTASSWGETPVAALKAMHTATHAMAAPRYAPGRMDIFHTWTGNGTQHIASGDTKRQIVKTAAKYLNEGLYGQDLLRALRAKFEVRDLKASVADLKPVLAEQGLQGIYYVDPVAYEDYGHGCKQASSLFRSKQIPYVKLSNKCGSCVHNVNGTCSQLNKPLVVEPPYADKKAQQQAILATGPAMEMNPAVLVNSGLSMMAEYQLQNGGMDFDLEPTKETTASTTIELGSGKIKI